MVSAGGLQLYQFEYCGPLLSSISSPVEYITNSKEQSQSCAGSYPLPKDRMIASPHVNPGLWCSHGRDSQSTSKLHVEKELGPYKIGPLQ